LLLQSAPQVVVAVARTIQFYSVQSDVQLNAHTHQQVVAAARLIYVRSTQLIIPQISSCMKAWVSTFGMEGMMQSLGGETQEVQAAFNTLFQ
jgi:hypothetical protein